MLITKELLAKLHACPGQVARFTEMWPTGADLTPENVRKALAADLSVKWLARNAATPKETLLVLAADGDPNVRWGAASNAATPKAALLALAADGDPSVRREAAWNAATPKETLLVLAADGDPDVRREAAENIKQKENSDA